MDALPDENTLKTIKPVSDDFEQQLERLRNRELLPAEVLIELCEKVFVRCLSNSRQRRLSERRITYKLYGVR